ncbi:MAG: hypothetical protein JWN92_1615 [Candidatus Acidoferrum typicum]|nr:hypothetical protein [Candidatus Acidoferrum typicum]
MGNGQCLSELRPANRFLDYFVEKCVCVVMKPLHVGAGEQQEGVGGTAEVKIWRCTGVHFMEIACRDRRLRSFTRKDDTLRAEKHVTSVVSRTPVGPGVSDRSGRSQKFQSRSDGKLYDFIQPIL